jgi:hypothetical protein
LPESGRNHTDSSICQNYILVVRFYKLFKCALCILLLNCIILLLYDIVDNCLNQHVQRSHPIFGPLSKLDGVHIDKFRPIRQLFWKNYIVKLVFIQRTYLYQ